MSLTKWKERERKQRQNDIIKAARKLFASKNFNEVSMDEIANEVGLEKVLFTFILKIKNHCTLL
jgi:AcrR family transcriptional regulator